MSTPSDERSVTRTYRSAVRLGEDFITIEETITLPLNASDEEVQQAVELGWRIYRVQREALEQQVVAVREAHGTPAQITVRDPDAPASDKQRNYIATLQDHLAWTTEDLAGYAGEHSVDLVTLTKGQASAFIDGLKTLAEERARYSADQRAHTVGESPVEGSQPASERQIQALTRLAQSRSLDLDEETERRFSLTSANLSDEQARLLISEWQPRAARGGGRRAESTR